MGAFGSGSVGAAGWIAQVAFLVLLVAAWIESGPKLVLLFAVLWVAGRVGLGYITYGSTMFTPYVAVLDIVLVLIVFKGDVRVR